MAYSNILTPASEVHTPHLKTPLEGERSEQRALAWLQRYGVRHSASSATGILTYEDDKHCVELDDVKFARKETDGTSGSYEGVIRTKDNSRSTDLPEGTFRHGILPEDSRSSEPVGKGTVGQFPPPKDNVLPKALQQNTGIDSTQKQGNIKQSIVPQSSRGEHFY